MKKALATAGVLTALALTSVPAEAATPTTQATATVNVLRPLTIAFNQNLDFGTVVLGTGVWSGEVLDLSAGNTLTCGGGTNLTCFGTHKVARYDLAGSANANVKVTSPGFNLTGPGAATLAFTPNFTANRTLDSTGALTISLGGQVTLASNTVDGVYTGTFSVTADYQ